MTRSAYALVKPELLVWARESARIPSEYAAKKLKVSEAKLQSWESGESRPTVKQLRRMARVYRQTFAAFYLSEPPVVSQPVIRDYRRFPSAVSGQMPLSVTFEIRAALDRREVSLELLESIGEVLPEFKINGHLSDDPESLGADVRRILEVTYDVQRTLNDNRLSFNYWRTIIENKGVLVFQAPDIDLEAMRGFSICEFPLPIIVINRKDAYAARVFTLLHELAHIIIRISGVCDIDDGPGRQPEAQSVEVFCNHFAGSCLVPSAQLLAEDIVIRAGERKTFNDEDISRLASCYGVSREVILRRLLILDRIDLGYYQTKREQFLEAYKPRKKGYIPPAIDTVSVSGKPFVRIVLDAFGTGRITASDVADYLNVKLKHVNKIGEIISI